MRQAQLTRSMSRKGCSLDNAACEGFFGRLKNEMYYHRNWLDTTIERFMQKVDAYVGTTSNASSSRSLVEAPWSIAGT